MAPGRVGVQALCSRAVEVTVRHEGTVEGHTELAAVRVASEDQRDAFRGHRIQDAKVGGVRETDGECVGRSLEQQPVDFGFVLVGDGPEFCWKGEHHMEVGDWQQLRPACPPCAVCSSTAVLSPSLAAYTAAASPAKPRDVETALRGPAATRSFALSTNAIEVAASDGKPMTSPAA